MTRTWTVPLAACLLLVLSAMSGCSPDRPPTPAAPVVVPDDPPIDTLGRIRIELVDAPGDFTAVNLLIDRVEAHTSDPEADTDWLVLCDEPSRHDLLALTNGISAVLADSTAPAGDYDQLRLVLGDDCTVEIGGSEHELKVPSGSESGIKINHEFSVSEGRISNLVLDFDAAASIHRVAGGNGSGKDRYLMSPVIRAVDAETAGSIVGVVLPVEAAARLWTLAGTDTISTLVDEFTGAFALVYLPAGMYDVHIEATRGTFGDTLVTGLEVFAETALDLGVIELPGS